MSGLHHPQITELLKEVRQRPSYPVYQRVEARLAALEHLAVEAGQRRARIAVLSSFTIDPIKPYLRMGCLERSIWAEVFLPGFNQFAQQMLDGKSELYAFQPDVCFLHVLPEALTEGSLSALVKRFRRSSPAELVIANFAAPARFPYALADKPDGRSAELNRELKQLASEVQGIHVLDYEGLTAFHGKESVADERLRHIARMELSDRFLPKLANKMLAYVLALRGFARKCVVLDLDNTLWGGVIGEDGPGGIQLGADYPGSAFVEFQRSLLALQQRGILLALNSKNNEADALEALAHPAMVLKPEHFSARRINWRDKCENLEAIAEELNIGLESLVFIDDNPAERELVRQRRPEVLTPEWPADPVAYRMALESLCDFGLAAMTEEDRKRGAMYAAQGQREALKQRSGTLEEYLHSLKTEVFIHQARPEDLARIHQLIQKTNQFNLTTRRHSLATLERWSRHQSMLMYALRTRDTFGDNGLVGVAILIQAPSQDLWEIDTLLMSCRVLGRTIEDGFLKFLLGELKERGCRTVMGQFIPTAKNALVKDFYEQAGFRPFDQQPHDPRWTLALDTYTPPALPWLNVNPEVTRALETAAAGRGGAG